MNRRYFIGAGLMAVLGEGTGQSITPVLPNVSLIDDQGRSLSLMALCEHRTVAVNFIFTGCVSFCPPQTAIFRAAQARFDELRGLKQPPLLLSISIDPLNDSAQSLARYASRFDARLGLAQGWLMLTGDVASIEKTSRAFGASSQRIDDHPPKLWVGAASKSRWLSSNGLASADDILRLMKAVAA
jgi:protein SCO1